MSLPPATSVFENRNMTEGNVRYVEVREQRAKSGSARANRSDTHSDWSTTLGANYTYRLYLLTMSRLRCLPTVYFHFSLTVQRSSPTFPCLQRLSMQPQDCVLDLIPLFPVDGAGWAR